MKTIGVCPEGKVAIPAKSPLRATKTVSTYLHNIYILHRNKSCFYELLCAIIKILKTYIIQEK